MNCEEVKEPKDQYLMLHQNKPSLGLQSKKKTSRVSLALEKTFNQDNWVHENHENTDCRETNNDISIIVSI